MGLTIAVDFDGTIVEHMFPKIGSPVPNAFCYMKKFQELGADLILWTMRADGQEHGNVLTEAIEFCKGYGIEFYGINTNPTQKTWTDSPKAYAQIYIDDAALGCPLCYSPYAEHRPFVNWDIVGPIIIKKLEDFNEEWNALCDAGKRTINV